MNYQSLWPGSEFYAYRSARPKGHTPLDAKKVTIKDKRKVRHYGNERFSAECLIQFEEGGTRWVPIRDIVEFWDNYIDEVGHIREQREEAQRAREQAARERQEARQRELQAHADRWGYPVDAIIDIFSDRVVIRRSALEERGRDGATDSVRRESDCVTN